MATNPNSCSTCRQMVDKGMLPGKVNAQAFEEDRMSALHVNTGRPPHHAAGRSGHLRVITDVEAARIARAEARRAREEQVTNRALAAADRWQEHPARAVPEVRRHKLVLTPQGQMLVRLLRALGAIILAATIGAGLGALLNTMPVGGERIVVGKGETLWSIAVGHGGDVRTTVAEIVSLNNLESSTVREGQVLILPAGD